MTLVVVKTNITVLFGLCVPSGTDRVVLLHRRIRARVGRILRDFDIALHRKSSHGRGQLLGRLSSRLRGCERIICTRFSGRLLSRSACGVHCFSVHDRRIAVLGCVTAGLNLYTLPADRGGVLTKLFFLATTRLRRRGAKVCLVRSVSSLLRTFHRDRLPTAQTRFRGHTVLFRLLGSFEQFVRAGGVFCRRCTTRVGADG